MDIFSWDTSAQWSGIDLIVSGFNVVHIFGKEVETDFGPWGVFPLSSDNEWDDSKAVWSDWLDWEKLIRAVLTGKVIDGWNKRNNYKLQFQVYFWIRFLKCGYSTDCRRLRLNLILHSLILWDDLHYFKEILCWISPL